MGAMRVGALGADVAQRLNLTDLHVHVTDLHVTDVCIMYVSNTTRINTKYNIIRIIHNTARSAAYYPTLGE